MRHEAEVTRGVLVAEGGDTRSQVHHTCNHAKGIVRERRTELRARLVCEHHVATVLHNTHVHMQAASSLTCGNLRSKRHVQSFTPSQIANHPLGYHQLVGSIAHGNRQELNLVLLVHQSVLLEVAHFGMTVLDLSACLGDVVHAASSEVVGLGIGSTLVIATLVDGGIDSLSRLDDIILQLTHRLVVHSRHLAEGFCSAAKCLLGRRCQRLTVLVEEGTEQTERGNLGKRIDKSRRVARQHIEVAGRSLNEREQARTVDTLTTCQDGVQVGEVADDEVQRLQLSVTTRIHEVHHLDAVFLDEANNVLFCKFLRQLLQVCHHAIGVQRQTIVFHVVFLFKMFRCLFCCKGKKNFRHAQTF